MLTDGVTKPHPFLSTGATPKFIDNDQTGVGHVLEDVVYLAHLMRDTGVGENRRGLMRRKEKKYPLENDLSILLER